MCVVVAVNRVCCTTLFQLPVRGFKTLKFRMSKTGLQVVFHPVLSHGVADRQSLTSATWRGPASLVPPSECTSFDLVSDVKLPAGVQV